MSKNEVTKEWFKFIKLNWILIVGIVLLVIGGLVFFKGYSGVKELRNEWGEVWELVSEKVKNQHEAYELMEFFGGIIAIAGLVIIVADILLYKKF